MDEDIKTLFLNHRSVKVLADPLFSQLYETNLLYLHFHQRDYSWLRRYSLKYPIFNYNGIMPKYDVSENIHVGITITDRWAKGRWVVSDVDTSVNLKAIRATAAILGTYKAPSLFVILPYNRKFYSSNGINIKDMDRKFSILRKEIRHAADKNGVLVLDCYDTPSLDKGWIDRMHMDEYGNYQLSAYMLKSDEFREFSSRVRDYYSKDFTSVVQ